MAQKDDNRAGDAIKRARVAKGLTQAELAQKLGVSPSYVGQYESGNRRAKSQTLARIAEALDIPSGILIGESIFQQTDESDGGFHKLRLKELREAKGLSMKETARQMGIPYTTYVNYEKGLREPSTETIIAMRDFYGCSLEYILNARKAPDENRELISDELVYFFSRLNSRGKAEAIKRIRELTMLPQYQKEVSPNDPDWR